MNKRPIEPAKPLAFELVVYYACPYCLNHCPVLSPTQPTMAMCTDCHKQFPIVPIDESSMQFLRVIWANGPAAIDPDFL